MPNWIVMEIFEDQDDDNNVATEPLRNEEGAVAFFANEDDAKRAADAAGLSYYDCHDLDLIEPAEQA